MEQKTEAIILADGKGECLAPLTEDTPKPMLKIMGKSVLECVLEGVERADIERVGVATAYLPWQIETLGGRRGKLEISYTREKKPLGTAGAVRNAFSTESDVILVLPGDVLYDFDPKKALEFHAEKNADVTVVTCHCENPLKYGIVLSSEDGKIIRFEEKTPWSKATPGTVNTGIYILNREIIERIPENCEYDLLRQLFPLLLAEKRAVYAFNADGVWPDTGSLDGYFSAVCSALDGKLDCVKNDGFTQKELEEMQVDAEMPIYVSRNAVIGRNVRLGAYTSIGSGVVVADNCDISGSVISDGTVIGMGCGIYGTLIGRNARFGENCITSEGCAVGAEAEVEDSVILPKYSIIHSTERVSKHQYRPISFGKKEHPLFGENGIMLDTAVLPPEFAMRVGYSTATALIRKNLGSARIGVMHTDGNRAESLAGIILEGIVFSGAKGIDFDTGFRAMAKFASAEYATDAVIFVGTQADGKAYAEIFGIDGKSISDSTEREISAVFFGSEEYRPPERFYDVVRSHGVWFLYYSRLIKECRRLLGESSLCGRHFSFGRAKAKSYSPIHTAMCAINELSGEITTDPEKATACFDIDSDGISSSCVCRDCELDEYHMNAVILRQMPHSGGEIDFPSDVPYIYDGIFEERGFSAKLSDEDLHGENTLKSLFFEDGVFRTLYFAILACESPATAYTLTKQMPSFEVYTERADIAIDQAEAMRRLSELSGEQAEAEAHNGVRIEMPGGRVTVIPGRLAGFRIIAEATSTEAAKELCAEARRSLV